MLSRVYSACPQGVSAKLVMVEVDARDGKVRVSIVGLPDAATRESRERLIPAITNSGFSFIEKDVVINLSPADLPKEGTCFDLPMAVGVLVAIGVIPGDRVEDALFLGELALDGGLRPVRAVLAGAECARSSGLKKLYVPCGNGNEAALCDGIEIYELADLGELVALLRGGIQRAPCRRSAQNEAPHPFGDEPDFADVRGQAAIKRALEIAAAGQHNILLFGPPGSGKSMLSRCLPGILPPMGRDEMIEVTRIHSIAGKLDRGGAVLRRPFRAPHHTASAVAMVGGGSYPRPGEVTLSHRGILFLDEFPEFSRIVLEVLRQPLEDRQVTVSRAAQQVTFPCDFMLVAAMNPCPCGWRGDHRRSCECHPGRIKTYRDRISGPLLDRIDLHVEVPSVPLREARRLPPAERSQQVRTRICRARERQLERFGSQLQRNTNMGPRDLANFCSLSDSLTEFLDQQVESLGYSSRVHAKILRVARTIADLDEREHLEKDDLLEALGYRQFEPKTTGKQIEEVRR